MKIGATPPILSIFLALAFPAWGVECSALGVGPVAVVELYTSEGCSSCPPVDHWLSRLPPRDAGPVRVIPLALHVTYWDDLGWRDPFADPRFDARQRNAARRLGSGVVYTPQVRVNGQDFRGWRTDGLDALLPSLASRPTNARLEIVGRLTPQGATLTVTGEGPPGAQVSLVRTEDGLSSVVRAGENAGRRLSHDHVAREWTLLGAVGPANRFRFQASTPGFHGTTGFVALVEDPASGAILQAARLGTCPGGA